MLQHPSVPRCGSDGAHCHTSHLSRHHICGDCAALGPSCWRAAMCISPGLQPPSIKHPSPKNQFWDHLLFKDVANTLTKRASNIQITPASTSEPCGSANSCPTSGFQLLAQRWVWQGHRNRGWWAKVEVNAACRAVLKPPQLLRLQFCKLDLRRPLLRYLSLCPGVFYILICF